MGEGRSYGTGGYLARNLITADKLELDNMVLSITAGGKVQLCDAGAVVYGIASRTTQNKLARVVGLTQYDTGDKISGGISVFKSGIAELPLASGNAAIAIGDRIVVGAGTPGIVNRSSAEASVSDKFLTVGYAEEAKAANSGGTVLTNLTIATGGAP